MSSQPWYTYPSDAPGSSYGQIIDPLGNYLKPDVNFRVPSGTPITALSGGVVTSVSDLGGCCGGLSVTVKMNTPLNSLATHTSYNFLGSTSVQPGQSISYGQQIGTAGSSYGINQALALTSDNVWGNGTFNQNAQGNPLLDPHLLLASLGSSASAPSSSSSSSSSSGGILGFNFFAPLINFVQSAIITPIQSFFSNVFTGAQAILSWVSNPVRIIKMVGGVACLGVAGIMFISPTMSRITGEAAQKLTKGASKAVDIGMSAA